MTASASVVEAVLLMKLKELICDQSGGEWTDEMIEDEAHRFAAALSSLFTPQPAEQDAREAVARVEDDLRTRNLYDEGEGSPRLKVREDDLRTLLALTQAAPDGWREVIAELLDHSVSRYGHPKDEAYGVGLTHARARAMISASPAPQADGWKPIETAPKDGTKFDGWRRDERVTDMYWSDIQEAWCTDGTYGPEEPTPLAIYPLVTHWQPAPAPPAQGAGG